MNSLCPTVQQQISVPDDNGGWSTLTNGTGIHTEIWDFNQHHLCQANETPLANKVTCPITSTCSTLTTRSFTSFLVMLSSQRRHHLSLTNGCMNYNREDKKRSAKPNYKKCSWYLLHLVLKLGKHYCLTPKHDIQGNIDIIDPSDGLTMHIPCLKPSEDQ